MRALLARSGAAVLRTGHARPARKAGRSKGWQNFGSCWVAWLHVRVHRLAGSQEATRAPAQCCRHGRAVRCNAGGAGGAGVPLALGRRDMQFFQSVRVRSSSAFSLSLRSRIEQAGPCAALASVAGDEALGKRGPLRWPAHDVTSFENTKGPQPQEQRFAALLGRKTVTRWQCRHDNPGLGIGVWLAWQKASVGRF